MSVSPAYDLTFSSGPAGEHCTTFMGEGKEPTLFHLLKLADIVGIKKQKALQIIDEVKHAISKWEIFAKNAGTTNSSCAMIKRELNECNARLYKSNL